LCTILFTLTECSPERNNLDNTIIASVSDKNLTIGEAMNNIPEFLLQEDSVRAIQTFANQWVQSQVSIEHAKRLGIQNLEQYRNKLSRFQDQLLVSMLKEQILETNADQIEVTRDEALSYYQTYREQFTFDERFVRFRLISTRTRTEAENANRELISGVEWETILQNYSVNPDLQLRQSTQYWPISMAATDIPPINENLNTLGLNERSPIHFHNNRYHLIQLIDEKTEGEYPELDWLIPQISEWLNLEKSRRITNGYLRNLYLQAESNNEIELLNVSDIEQLLTQ
tara:strand:- start:60296 stop:61150 length:855 start_codon:yes stop_codon:yes gene_type:complete